MTDHARKAAEEIVDALGLPHDHGTEEESDFAAIISRAIAESERELVEALEPVILALVVMGNAESKVRPDSHVIWECISSDPRSNVRLTVGMVRAARAVLANRGRK